MKKIIATSAVVAVLFTSVQADFVFGDVFKDLKEDPKVTVVRLPNDDFLFGDVFKDLKEDPKVTVVRLPNDDFLFGDVFKDLKEAEITMSKDAVQVVNTDTKYSMKTVSN